MRRKKRTELFCARERIVLLYCTVRGSKAATRVHDTPASPTAHTATEKRGREEWKKFRGVKTEESNDSTMLLIERETEKYDKSMKH